MKGSTGGPGEAERAAGGSYVVADAPTRRRRAARRGPPRAASTATPSPANFLAWAAIARPRRRDQRQRRPRPGGRLRPSEAVASGVDLAVWYHQPWNETLIPCDSRARYARRYAAIARTPKASDCRIYAPGSAIGWRHHRFGTVAFVVELSRRRQRELDAARGSRRHASAHGGAVPGCRSGVRRLLEGEVAVGGVDPDRVALGELALEQLQRQPVDELALDHPLERPGAVGRVVAEVAEQRLA